MIDTVVKFVPLYLSPILALTSTFLTLFVYLAPDLMLHSQVSLVTISPGRLVSLSGDPKDSVDGPTVRMGMLGSCAQTSDSAANICTSPSTSPIYDFSALPSNTPSFMQGPPATTPGWVAASLAFWGLFLIIYLLSTFHHRLGSKLSGWLSRPVVTRSAAWTGFLSYMIGLTAFLINRVWFGNAVNNFNIQIAQMGTSGPDIQANISNGFTMLWVAYAFSAVSIVCVLMKLHNEAAPPAEKV